MKKKYLIGLGCSWTIGEGSYPDEIWEKYNYKPQQAYRENQNLTADFSQKYWEPNSWVQKLCDQYLTDHIPMNLGIGATGIGAAMYQLNYTNTIDFENTTGLIILFLSGVERMDFPMNMHHISHDAHNYDTTRYNTDNINHVKCNTVWAHQDQFLFNRIYTTTDTYCTQALTNILNVQNFAKAHNYEFVFANAINCADPWSQFESQLRESNPYFYEKVNWNNYMNNYLGYNSFLELLVKRDGAPISPAAYFNYYKSLKRPRLYLTNDEGTHPTTLGYQTIANEMARFLKEKLNYF